MIPSKSCYLPRFCGDQQKADQYFSFELCVRIARCYDFDIETTAIANASLIPMRECDNISSFFHRWTRLESLQHEYFQKVKEMFGSDLDEL